MGLLDIIKNSHELQITEQDYNKVVNLTNVIFDKTKSDKDVRKIIDKFFKENIK